MKYEDMERYLELVDGVCRVTGLTKPQLLGRRRTDRICYARYILCAVCRYTFPNMTWQQLSECLGRRDHGTAMNAERRAIELYRKSDEFRDDVSIAMGRGSTKQLDLLTV